MHAEILKIDQSYPLDGSEPHNYVVIELQNGKVIRGEISDEATVLLLEAAKLNGATPYKAPVVIAGGANTPNLWMANPRGVVDIPFTETPEAQPEQSLVEWAALPDEALSPMMKQMFATMGIPALISFEDIERLVNSVIDGMQDADRKDTGTAQPSVSVSSGHIVRRIPPIKTVQKDEMGNPIVHGLVRRADDDPGEVLGDEDGVDQL